MIVVVSGKKKKIQTVEDTNRRDNDKPIAKTLIVDDSYDMR
jgi:hypothetical protein